MVSISSFSFGVLSILNSHQTSFNYFLAQSLKSGTVEPRYDGPLHNEVLGKRTIFFTPVRVKYMKKNLDTTKPRYSELILPVPWPFVISRFHCNCFNQVSHSLILSLLRIPRVSRRTLERVR